MSVFLSLSGLNAREAHWIDYVKSDVVGKLTGSAEERARTAAIVTWWALKEGVLDLPNPWRHSLCGRGQIGDLAICPESVWQLGMSGIQPNAVSDGIVEGAAAEIYPGETFQAILGRIGQEAGVDEGAAAAIRQSGGDLRKAWLLRDPAISFTLQRPFVETQCIQGHTSWCFGGWDSARRFASSHERIVEVVDSLTDYFRDAPPRPTAGAFGSGTRTLLILAVLGGTAYWFYRAGGLKLLAR